MKTEYIISVFLIFFLSNLVNAQDLDTIQNSKLTFSPAVGGQFELTSLFYVLEFGALIDIDLLKKESKLTNSFGTRISYESFGYLEFGGPTGGGPFKDYCIYIIYSARSESFHFNIFGGLAYHTKSSSSSFYPDETLFRAGIELRYNLLNKMVGLLFKGSTSFDERTSFIGLGIAIGFYK
jgi:hypothetical protein